MTYKRTVFVLGATGGIGGEVTLALLQGGWRVRGLHRQPGRAAQRAQPAQMYTPGVVSSSATRPAGKCRPQQPQWRRSSFWMVSAGSVMTALLGEGGDQAG